jgi:hypothetical protein
MATKPPPAPADVALRALSLQALVARAQIEQDVFRHKDARPRWLPVLQKISAWLDEEGVRAALSPVEGALLSQPAFSWTEEEAKDAVWRVEAVATLLWCLRRLKNLPPFFEAAPVDVVDDALPPLSPTLAFVRDAALRPATEIDALRRTAGIWAWRSKTELVGRRAGSAGEARVVALRGVAQARDKNVVGALVEGDLPIGTAPFFSASTADVLFTATIAHERSHALEWVLGKRMVWSDDGAML